MFSMLLTIICLYLYWTDKDSKDLAYVRKVIEFIDSNPTMFNNEKIYIQGDFCIFYELVTARAPPRLAPAPRVPFFLSK